MHVVIFKMCLCRSSGPQSTEYNTCNCLRNHSIWINFGLICGGYNASTCGVFIPSQVNCPLSIIKNQSLHSFFQQHFSTHELLASFASCFWIHPTDLLRWSSMKCSKAGTTWDVWPSLSSVCWLWPRAIVGVDTNYDFQQTCQMKSAYLLNINWQMDLYMFVAWKEPSTISTICKNLTWLLHKLGNMAGQAFTGATNQPQGYQITLDSRQEQMEENSSFVLQTWNLLRVAILRNTKGTGMARNGQEMI